MCHCKRIWFWHVWFMVHMFYVKHISRWESLEFKTEIYKGVNFKWLSTMDWMYFLQTLTEQHWACSQENESRSERRFGTWFGPFLIWKPDFTLCECKALSNQAFETRFETRKKGGLDRDPCRKPDSSERKALSERDSFVCILEMRTEAMHGSISADCAVGTKYYLAVRRSWSWLGRRLQCMWTHILQITIPIRKRITIQNVFWKLERDLFRCEHSHRLMCKSFYLASVCIKITWIWFWLVECINFNILVVGFTRIAVNFKFQLWFRNFKST